MSALIAPGTLAGEWDQLAERSGAPPFLYPGWFACWQAAFGGGRPELISTRDGDGALAAIMPVNRRAGTVATAANWHSPMFGAVLRDRDSAGGLAESLLGGRAARLDLSFLPSGDPLDEELTDRAAARGLTLIRRVIQRSPYIDLDGSFDDFRAGLPTKRRADLRRRWRRLNEAGTVSVDVNDGNVGLAKALEDGFRVEAAGWKGDNGTAIASRPETGTFYTGLARWAAERGWLRLWFLRLDGRAIAFEYTLVHDGICYALKGGYDPEMSRYAPSKLLIVQLIEWLFAQSMRRFEFLGQDEPYKLDWTGTCNELVRVQVFSSGFAGSVSRIAWSRGRPLARQAKGALARVRSRGVATPARH